MTFEQLEKDLAKFLAGFSGVPTKDGLTMVSLGLGATGKSPYIVSAMTLQYKEKWTVNVSFKKNATLRVVCRASLDKLNPIVMGLKNKYNCLKDMESDLTAFFKEQVDKEVRLEEIALRKACLAGDYTAREVLGDLLKETGRLISHPILFKAKEWTYNDKSN